MTPPHPARSDWVEGERVFGPPLGTYDADWVAGAAVALSPGLGRARALRLAHAAWEALRSGTPQASLAEVLGGGPDETVVASVASEFCALYGVDPGDEPRAPGHGSAMRDDPFALQRFVDAQDASGTYDSALDELRAGRKTGHWIWFVLPQLDGLGRSATAQRYALGGLDDARAYLAHPVLGPRLRTCARVLADLPDTDPVRVMGGVDAQKLHSSMTLFARADPGEPAFRAVLDRWYGGVEDPGTTRLLGGPGSPGP